MPLSKVPKPEMTSASPGQPAGPDEHFTGKPTKLNLRFLKLDFIEDGPDPLVSYDHPVYETEVEDVPCVDGGGGSLRKWPDASIQTILLSFEV